MLHLIRRVRVCARSEQTRHELGGGGEGTAATFAAILEQLDQVRRHVVLLLAVVVVDVICAVAVIASDAAGVGAGFGAVASLDFVAFLEKRVGVSGV